MIYYNLYGTSQKREYFIMRGLARAFFDKATGVRLLLSQRVVLFWPRMVNATLRSPPHGTCRIYTTWVTEISGKAPYREMRGLAGREKQPQSGALGTANQQPAS